MAAALTFAPATPTSGSGVLFKAAGVDETAVGAPSPVGATIVISRDADAEEIARSPLFGTSEAAATSDAVNTLAITGTGGTYTLSVDGHVTAPIAFGANAAAIEAAITAAAGSAVVAVSGTGPFTLTSENLDLNKAETIVVDATSLTGGGATVTVATAGGVAGGFTDAGGAYTFGPIVMKTGVYHGDVRRSDTDASILGATVVITVI